MRRTLPAAALALTAMVGLASPALAADAPATTPDRPIHLSCHEVTADDSKPAIHCDWNAFPGATGYRIVAVDRRGRHFAGVVRRTTQTSFTRKDVKPGHYNFVVQAVGQGSKKAIARSNRERVVVDRDVRTAG